MPTDWGGGAGAGIAQSLEELGRIRAQQAEQQGQIWGGSLANLGNLIAQAPQRAALEDERKARAFELQGLAQDRQMKAQQMQQTQQHQAQLGQFMQQAANDPSMRDETGRLDFSKLAEAVAPQDPKTAAEFLQMHDRVLTARKTLGDVNAQRAKLDDEEANKVASVAATTTEPYSLLAGLHSAGVSDAKIKQISDGLESGTPYETVKSGLLSASSEWRKQQSEKPKEGPKVVGNALVAPTGDVLYQGEKTPQRPVEVRTVDEHGRPVTKFMQPEQVSGQTFPSQPPASISFPKPDAAAKPAKVIEPGTPDFKIAQDLASGKLTFPQFRTLSAYSRDVEGKKAIYALAADLNQEFNPAQYELGFKMASNPAIRQRVVAISSLDPVINKIEDLSDKVGNGDITAWNRILNSAKLQLGNRPVTNFRQMQILLGDEVGNALGLGSGSDLKTKLGIDLVNPNLSPTEFRTTMQQLRDVLEPRKANLIKQMGIYGAGVADQNAIQAKEGDTKPIPGFPGTEQTFRGGKWIRTK